MRIAQVAHSLSARTNGVVVAVYNISKELAKRGHEVVIYASDADANREFVDSLPEVAVRTYRSFLSFGGFYPSAGMVGQMRTEIQQFDIVHMHNFRTFQNIAAHYFARRARVPYVLQAHGSALRIVEKQKAKQVFDRLWGHRLLRDASRLIAVSQTEVRQYQQMRVGKDRIAMIPNGLEVDSLSMPVQHGAFRQKHGINEKHLVLYLGRIHKVKGIDFLINAFSALLGETEDVMLAIAGPDDGYQSEMEHLVHTLNLDSKVKFVGSIAKQDRAEAYVDATVFVYPSEHEIFGFPAFEAILCGTPVIVTSECGCGEFIEKAQAGQLVRYGDILGLKHSLQQVLGNPTECAEAAERGKTYVLEHLTWTNVVRQLETLYSEIVNSKGRTARSVSHGGQ